MYINNIHYSTTTAATKHVCMYTFIEKKKKKKKKKNSTDYALKI